jgi:hypothetical protein
MIPVPDKCLICGAEWSGGHEIPGNEMLNGLRVFYDCGCSMSCERLSEGYKILIKNCERELYAKKKTQNENSGLRLLTKPDN